MNKIWLLMGCAAALALGAEVMAQEPAKVRKPKVLSIMLDGLRGDALDTARVPTIDSLRNGTWAEGYHGASTLTALTVPDALPLSAANHTAILTAVDAVKSRVYKNGQTKNGNFKDWPTWLTRVTQAVPGTKALFIYSWEEGNLYARTPNVQFIQGTDAANGANIGKILAAPDAPDVTQYFIDLTDLYGHMRGFYPFGLGYLWAVSVSDRYIANALAGIKSRPTFKDEDWLIMVTGDHGGYHDTHAVWGGNASTVPVVLSGRNTPSGRIPGVPRHYDLTATALKHFGLDPVALKLEGRPITVAVPKAAPRALKDGLAAYLDFQEKTPVNTVKGGPVAKVLGPRAVSGVAEGVLRLTGAEGVAGGVMLEGSEKLAFENGDNFTVTLWARMPATQTNDPLIFGNKDWNRGSNLGMALIASKAMDRCKVPGVVFNVGRPNRGRMDIGQFDVMPDQWVFYAVTRDAEGRYMLYQGRADGRFHFICNRTENTVVKTGLPICIGQDGTGRYPCIMNGDIDDFALWTRALTYEDVKSIYEAGRQGLHLADLL